MNDDLRLDELPDGGDPTATLLRTVLHREADAIEPSADGYARIRAEIESRALSRVPRTARTARAARRLTPLLAAAAAVVVVATGGIVAVRSLTHRSQAQPASGVLPLRTVENDVRQTPQAALPVYVAARQNGRIVLFREFRRQSVQGPAGTQVAAAVRLALTTGPSDPDYLRLFAAGAASTVRATVTADLVSLDISPAPRAASAAPSREEATAALQQLVWTATAAAAVATTPATAVRSVRITLDGRSGQALFGQVALDHVLDRQFGGDPRARAWVIEPAEDSTQPAGLVTASGDAVAGSDGQVHVTLVRDGTTRADVDVPLTPADGGSGQVRPGQRGVWRLADLDASEPGTYRLEVSTTDADGRRWSDTKTFTTR